MAEQVEATVLKIGTGALFLETQSWSFPTQEIAIESVVDGDINSSIIWNGVKYYCSETASSLISAANASGGGSSYLVYSGNLNQLTTSAPTCTPNQNTLGGAVSFTYQDVGDYEINGEGLFGTAAKFEVFIDQNKAPDGFFSAQRQSDSVIRLRSYENNFDGTFLLANGYLENTSIEIRVHP